MSNILKICVLLLVARTLLSLFDGVYSYSAQGLLIVCVNDNEDFGSLL